jgi:hypothetical protein
MTQSTVGWTGAPTPSFFLIMRDLFLVHFPDDPI